VSSSKSVEARAVMVDDVIRIDLSRSEVKSVELDSLRSALETVIHENAALTARIDDRECSPACGTPTFSHKKKIIELTQQIEALRLSCAFLEHKQCGMTSVSGSQEVDLTTISVDSETVSTGTTGASASVSAGKNAADQQGEDESESAHGSGARAVASRPQTNLVSSLVLNSRVAYFVRHNGSYGNRPPWPININALLSSGEVIGDHERSLFCANCGYARLHSDSWGKRHIRQHVIERCCLNQDQLQLGSYAQRFCSEVGAIWTKEREFEWRAKTLINKNKYTHWQEPLGVVPRNNSSKATEFYEDKLFATSQSATFNENKDGIDVGVSEIGDTPRRVLVGTRGLRSGKDVFVDAAGPAVEDIGADESIIADSLSNGSLCVDADESPTGTSKNADDGTTRAPDERNKRDFSSTPPADVRSVSKRARGSTRGRGGRGRGQRGAGRR
jgi:hypothetical protein